MEQNLTRPHMNIKYQSRFKLIVSEADSYFITACGNKLYVDLGSPDVLINSKLEYLV